jgi:hypothetical protein
MLDAKTLHFRRENVVLGQKVIKYNIFEIFRSLYVRIFVKIGSKKLKFSFGAFLQCLAGGAEGVGVGADHEAKTLHFRRENVVLGQKVIKYNIFGVV